MADLPAMSPRRRALIAEFRYVTANNQQRLAADAARAAANAARSDRADRRRATRDAAEAGADETPRPQSEELRMAILRAEQDNARREETLAFNRAQELQENNRLRDQAAATRIADEEAAAEALAQVREEQHNVWRDRERTNVEEHMFAERVQQGLAHTLAPWARQQLALDQQSDDAWDRMVAIRAADRLAATQERSRRIAEDLRERQQIYENTDRYDYEQAIEQQAQLRRRQNYERDVRALQRDARRESDVLAPPPIPVTSRVADRFATAFAWLRSWAAVPREDQPIRDRDDVLDDRDEDSQTCTTCLVNKRAVICLPCGHCTQCNACWQQWKSAPDIEGHFHGPTCPVCRKMAVHTLKITQQERDALSANADPVPRHAGSWAHRVPAGPIYMNAQMPGAPLQCMHSLLDGLSA